MAGRHRGEVIRVLGRYHRLCPSCGRTADQPFDHETVVEADELTTDADLARQVAAEAPLPRTNKPCRGCGRWDPREGADRRKWWDQWPGVFGPIGLAALTLLQFCTDRIVVFWSAAAAAPGLALMALLAVVLTARRVRVATPPGGPDPDALRRPAYALLAVAVVALAAHPLLRLSGPPLNDGCRPMVPAPGDTVRLSVGNSLRSLEQAWSGRARVTVRNAAEFAPPLPPPGVSTREEPQADVIVSSTRSSAGTPSTYVDVTLPDRPDLAGRTLRFAVSLSVEYPREVAAGRYWYEQAELSGDRDVMVATTGEAAADRWVGVAGSATGVILHIGATAWLFWSCRRLKQPAPPPDVLVDGVERWGH